MFTFWFYLGISVIINSNWTIHGVEALDVVLWRVYVLKDRTAKKRPEQAFLWSRYTGYSIRISLLSLTTLPIILFLCIAHILFNFFFNKNWYWTKQRLILVPPLARRQVYKTLNISRVSSEYEAAHKPVGSTVLKKFGLTARAGDAVRRRWPEGEERWEGSGGTLGNEWKEVRTEFSWQLKFNFQILGNYWKW